MGRTMKRETENKRAIGLDNPSPGSVSLGEMGGLGRNAMDEQIQKAVEYAKPKKRDGSKRKRGGQPGNTNGVKSGIYTRVDKFEKRFQSYSKALGRASAQEEVALTRAMMMNLLAGKTPLGDNMLDDDEFRESLVRDVMMMNLKAQELALKQEARRAEIEAKSQNDKGVTIMMSAEMDQALAGMVDAQDSALEKTADEMLDLAKKKLEEANKERAAAQDAGGDG